jgi:transposase
LDEAEVLLRERRQVRDLPRIRLRVTEHQALHVRCPSCQAVSVGAFPPEAPSRAQYGAHLRAFAVYLLQQQFVPYGRVRELCADLFGASLSLGTLQSGVRLSATTLARRCPQSFDRAQQHRVGPESRLAGLRGS